MANRLQLRKGTTAQNTAFTGANGELTYDTENKQIRVHDGSTAGGKIIDDTARNVTSQVNQATEAIAGKAKIATTAIAQAGVNDTDIITPLKLKAVSFGVGQTWQDVKSLRASGVVYTNTTGKPITVSFSGNKTSGSSTAVVVVGDVTILDQLQDGDGACNNGLSFNVPNNTTYSITYSGILVWSELR